MFPHVVEEKVCGSSSRDCSDSGNEMHMLCGGIVPCRLWQLDNEVHTDGIPRSRWNGKRMEFSGQRTSVMTSTDSVFTDLISNSR